MRKYLITALYFLFLLLAGPAFGAIVYDDGDVQSAAADPYVASFPDNAGSNTAVLGVLMDQSSGAVDINVIASDPDVTTWNLAATVTNGNAKLVLYTALLVAGASENIWAYLTAGIDGSSNNVQMYTGAVAIGVTNTATGSSTAPSIALTTQDANNFVVTMCGFIGNATWTADTGNLRDSYDGGGEGQAAIGAIDNTGAAGAITTSATLGSSKAWACAAVELRSTLGASPRRPIAPIMFQ